MINNIMISSQFKIDDYDVIAKDFLIKILGLKFEEVLITDLSSLSDFCGCGWSDEESDNAENSINIFNLDLNLTEKEKVKLRYRAYCNKWKKWVIVKINETYGIDVVSASIPLVELFEEIRKSQVKYRH